MILRFSCGSVTPASASRNRSDASTMRQRDVEVIAEQPSTTSLASPAAAGRCRRRCRRPASPIASWTSRAAATDESTPPDRPQMTRRSPTCCADRGDRLVEERRHRPVAAAAADPSRKLRRISAPSRRVADLGMELEAVEPAALVGDRGERAGRREAPAAAKPRRHGGDLVAVAHPDRLALAGVDAVEQRRCAARSGSRPGRTRGRGRARPRRPAGRTGLLAVADAQHRHAELEDRCGRSAALAAS